MSQPKTQTQAQQGLTENEVHELLGKKEIFIAIMQREISSLKIEIERLNKVITEKDTTLADMRKPPEVINDA